jgi:hypothetical protein
MTEMYAKSGRQAVSVLSLTGDARDVDVFLGPALHRYHQTETLGERLNTEGLRFLPVALGEKVELLQMDAIADVKVEGASPELEELDSVGAVHQSVVVHLATGDRLAGELVYQMPQGSPRVSDLLNSPKSRFLLLVQPGCCHYVNQKAVVRVEA